MMRLRLLLAWLLLAAVPLQGFAGASMLFCGGVPSHHAQSASAHDHAGHDAATHAQQDEGDAKQLPSALHTCAICATCCHGAALTQAAPVVQLPPAPSPVLHGPVVLIRSQPAQVPDKPPRG